MSAENSPAVEPRLIPTLGPEYDFFWEGAREGELRFQRCSDCDLPRFPVSDACRFCGSFAWRPWASSGRGTVFSYSFVRRPRVNYLPDDAAVAVISLEEGLRFPSNVLHVTPSMIDFGMEVEVIWQTVSDPTGTSALQLPLFVLA
ncbi:Zn-ribbon domain-containing OB-fold protein [Nocardia vaccinii]|uniref:Zn-ribbon domain-containing OB-fold protein n=1 Tax=Nocardia vaccinii TaxID=1822 RepID=UPI00147150CF|nr:zinc ribbon domain-containing protein [Nocardia vaccinii]